MRIKDLNQYYLNQPSHIRELQIKRILLEYNHWKKMKQSVLLGESTQGSFKGYPAIYWETAKNDYGDCYTVCLVFHDNYFNTGEPASFIVRRNKKLFNQSHPHLYQENRLCFHLQNSKKNDTSIRFGNALFVHYLPKLSNFLRGGGSW